MGSLANANFRTIKTAASVETTVKKSRFIAYAKPVSDERQALAFLHEVCKRHYDATHNCYAYIIDELVQKQSDDGEPSGTAGKPIIETMKHLQLEQVIVIVTRYYGGTLLGAGGLIRAYSDAASQVLHKAEIAEQRLHVPLYIELEYHLLGKLEHEARSRNWLTGETKYADRVTFCLLPQVEEARAVRTLLTEWTLGQAVISEGEKFYICS
jgi:uncharacterized YigZ family protein